LIPRSVKFETKCFTEKDESSLAIDGEAMAVLPTLDWSSETAGAKMGWLPPGDHGSRQ
jgi:hypothetical protein